MHLFAPAKLRAPSRNCIHVRVPFVELDEDLLLERVEFVASHADITFLGVYAATENVMTSGLSSHGNPDLRVYEDLSNMVVTSGRDHVA